MLRELWTPAGAAYEGVASAGQIGETGGRVVAHNFVLTATDKFGVEHRTRVSIVADEDMSHGQLAEMMGNAAESFKETVRTKYNKRPPTPEEKKEIGKAFNEFRTRALRRLQSTNRKIYY